MISLFLSFKAIKAKKDRYISNKALLASICSFHITYDANLCRKVKNNDLKAKKDLEGQIFGGNTKNDLYKVNRYSKETSIPFNVIFAHFTVSRSSRSVLAFKIVVFDFHVQIGLLSNIKTAYGC